MNLKYPLLLSALAVSLAGTATLAMAQSVAVSPGANTNLMGDKAVTEGDRTQLRSDRSKAKADREKYKADKASGNTEAARADKAELKADKQAKRSERGMVNSAHSTSEGARHLDKSELSPGSPVNPVTTGQ